MVIFKTRWKPSAAKELRGLDRQIIPRILKAVESLSSNPFPSGVHKLHGSEHSYRIRIGDYRVIYSVSESHLVIEIIRVRHRKNIYRK
ncbi:MAG: type II toxin-antitoxin system RelE/ParE family toxin [bacterium]